MMMTTMMYQSQTCIEGCKTVWSANSPVSGNDRLTLIFSEESADIQSPAGNAGSTDSAHTHNCIYGIRYVLRLLTVTVHGQPVMAIIIQCLVMAGWALGRTSNQQSPKLPERWAPDQICSKHKKEPPKQSSSYHHMITIKQQNISMFITRCNILLLQSDLAYWYHLTFCCKFPQNTHQPKFHSMGGRQLHYTIQQYTL